MHAVPCRKAYEDCRRKYRNLHQIANDTKEPKPSTNTEGMHCGILRKVFNSRHIVSFLANKSHLEVRGQSKNKLIKSSQLNSGMLSWRHVVI